MLSRDFHLVLLRIHAKSFASIMQGGQAPGHNRSQCMNMEMWLLSIWCTDTAVWAWWLQYLAAQHYMCDLWDVASRLVLIELIVSFRSSIYCTVCSEVNETNVRCLVKGWRITLCYCSSQTDPNPKCILFQNVASLKRCNVVLLFDLKLQCHQAWSASAKFLRFYFKCCVTLNKSLFLKGKFVSSQEYSFLNKILYFIIFYYK